jgi:hypothetical protein
MTSTAQSAVVSLTAMSVTHYTESNDWMTVNNELKRILKEAVIA